MRPAAICLGLLVRLAIPVSAQPTLEMDDLGGGSFDIQVSDLGGGTRWTTAGLFGTAENGAYFDYRIDPNVGGPLICQCGHPQWHDPDVTFVGLPTQQFAPERFDERGAPQIAGKYVGGTGSYHATAQEVDVAWFATPLAPAGTGFIARIVLDLGGTGLAAGDVFATIGPTPAGTTLLASGRVTSTTDAFTDAIGAEVYWSVYAIPEPTCIVLLTLYGLAAARRR